MAVKSRAEITLAGVTDLEGIEIGGRNYVLDSSKEKNCTRSTGNVFNKYDVTDSFRSLDSTGNMTISMDLKTVDASDDFLADFYIRTSKTIASASILLSAVVTLVSRAVTESAVAISSGAGVQSVALLPSSSFTFFVYKVPVPEYIRAYT